MNLTKTELDEWLNLKATREVMWHFIEKRSSIRADMGNGLTLDADAGTTAQTTARAVGEIAGLDYFIDKEFIEE